MTIGHRLDEDELDEATIYDLYSALGERDTAHLFARPFTFNTEFDISTGGANSMDRKVKYLDRTLFQEVMDGEFKATGLEPQQIIDRWGDHEHCEKCIVDGDNPVDTYYASHKRALRREHEGVLAILGIDDPAPKIKKYEATIWPGLVRCYKRPVRKAPLDMWCAPLNDDPDERDEEILAQLQSLGVVDAFKRSKRDTRYGMADHTCESCRNWSPQKLSDAHGALALCAVTAGLVRRDRGCDFWKADKNYKPGGTAAA